MGNIEKEDPESSSGGQRQGSVIARNEVTWQSLGGWEKAEIAALRFTTLAMTGKEIGTRKKKIQKKICT
ncbi:hypothetical protein CSB09_04205 [Candidatus Gracilibacteria bacterium]|nr:MAG: hypothetical protein CSB09_04205 [Candidatus Gracilibacteria bacterium]